MLDATSLWQGIIDLVTSIFPHVVPAIKTILGIFIGISIPISLFFFIGIIYCVEGLKRIRNKEAEIHDLKVEPGFEAGNAGDTALAHRWEKATNYMASENENDWKQSIIEADILLDDLLTRMGYRGESVGEKLKRVQPGEMKTIRDAWDAHMVRNDIAHRPGFVLDHHAAKEAYQKYRKVFEEFYYI